MPTTGGAPSDEDLMRQVADGSAESLGLLHRRLARLVFRVAAPTLDRAAAEDLVQDVFLAVWRNADRFDPLRGTVRAWVLQIAHFRLLNELRRRSRQPELAPDPDALALDGIAGHDPGPAEAASRRDRREILASALAELPPTQRKALDLAFLQDLTHEQVAAKLGLPLGTAKTRIRTGLHTLRAALASQWPALAVMGVLCALGLAYLSERATLARYDRALAMVTASDAVNLRLAPAPGTPAATHARYRGRPDVPIALITLSDFPSPPAGRTYQVWVRHGSTWTSLGTTAPDAHGSGRLIAEGAALSALPEAVQVTIEPRAGSVSPSGPVVVSWP